MNGTKIRTNPGHRFYSKLGICTHVVQKLAIAGLFSYIFGLFKQTIQYNFGVTTNRCEKYPPSIWCWDWNP